MNQSAPVQYANNEDFDISGISVQDDGIIALETDQTLVSKPEWMLRHLFFRSAKRVCDITFSVFGLLLCAPLLGVIAWAIRRDSSGPVLFVHRRPGRNGKLFQIYKFRTMTLDASKQFRHLAPEQRREFSKYGKICTDPRITKIGYWLRKYSLDELPQLWNVLKGDMSLVGPRPYLRSQTRELGNARMAIYLVAPGLTGLWQVSGRNSIPFEDRVQLDVHYVKNWSLLLDLWIMLLTPWTMITGKGAY